MHLVSSLSLMAFARSFINGKIVLHLLHNLVVSHKHRKRSRRKESQSMCCSLIITHLCTTDIPQRSVFYFENCFEVAGTDHKMLRVTVCKLSWNRWIPSTIKNSSLKTAFWLQRTMPGEYLIWMMVFTAGWASVSTYHCFWSTQTKPFPSSWVYVNNKVWLN